MRQFYLLANGGDLVRQDIYKDDELLDYVNTITGVGSITSLFESIGDKYESMGYVIQDIKHVMPIANTSGRNSIFIGHTGLYRDKIYISGELDDETGIIPITQISESFTQFIADLR